jgi:DNA-directed RNA polymerase subunit K/omega
MNFSDIDALNSIGDSKYSTCIAVAKRARELGMYLSAKRNMERINVIQPLIDDNIEDPLELAINEIKQGKVIFIKIKNEQK